MRLTARLLLAALLFAPCAWAQDVAYVASSNFDAAGSTGGDVGEPAGVAEGDLVLCGASINNTGVTFTAPADFIAIDDNIVNVNGGGATSAFWYKLRGATSGNGYTFTNTSSASFRAVCSAFTNVDQSDPFDVTFSDASHYNDANNNTTLAAPAITTVTDGAMVYIHQNISGGGISAAGAPSTYTLRYSEVGTSGRQVAVATKPMPTAGTETPGVWTHTSDGVDDPRNAIFAIRAAGASDEPHRRRDLLKRN